VIKLAEGFNAERSQYGWTLIDTTGKSPYKTYYASLAQVCQAVADKKAGECENCMAVMAMWKQFIEDVTDVTRGVK